MFSKAQKCYHLMRKAKKVYLNYKRIVSENNVFLISFTTLKLEALGANIFFSILLLSKSFIASSEWCKES